MAINMIMENSEKGKNPMKQVVIGIVNKNGKILMIKRAQKEGNLEWVFPGGKVEDGETKENACVREVFEETNIRVKVIRILGQRIHPNTNRDITYYLCEYVEGEEKITDSSEVLEIAYKSKMEFLRDVKTDVFKPVMDYINENIK